ncbi:O-antigen ligase [Vibrio diazotrophicus]|uniref:O-antigen ligase n=1 Tax=Vibrio diazotrophicus TaxID=685 RepID=A0A329E586_VIBDI|nr:O-antigen ligase [Vibrio diazotrophicus]
MPKLLTKIEITSLCLLFFSLFISKAGIYIGLSLLLLIQIYSFARNISFRELVARNRLLWGFIGLFCLGIASTLSMDTKDAITYFRKASILLVFPILYFQLRKSNNLQWAQVSLIAGLLVGLGNAFYELALVTEWNGQRITSFWDVGRWAECLGYSLAILIPLIFEHRNSFTKGKRLFYIILSVCCLIALVISGGRGPLLAITITSTLYLLLRSPKAFFTIALSLFAIFYVGKSFPPIEATHQRIASIADLHHNDSNNARLVMWQNGFNFAKYNLANKPSEFLFGVGIEHFESKYTQFLDQSMNAQNMLEQTNGEVSFKDLHNTYLDLLVKIGAIYALAYIVILVVMLKFFLIYRDQVSAWAYSGICLIITYGITSVFYTSGLEYQTTIFFALVALCYARVNVELKQNE